MQCCLQQVRLWSKFKMREENGEKFVNQHHSFAGLASDVGWFCWLIYDGQLQLSRASCSAVPIGQNDRALKRAAQHIVLDPVSLRFNQSLLWVKIPHSLLASTFPAT
jgi:hypothetical protein